MYPKLYIRCVISVFQAELQMIFAYHTLFCFLFQRALPQYGALSSYFLSIIFIILLFLKLTYIYSLTIIHFNINSSLIRLL